MKRTQLSPLSRFGLYAAVCVALSACQSVKMPNMDLLKIKDFEDEAANIADYPQVADAPAAPKDVRSDAQWDRDARKIMAVRDGFTVPVDGTPKRTEEEIEADIARLKAKAEAYKLDDPQ